MPGVEKLLGKVFDKIVISKDKMDVCFKGDETYFMSHDQECCEVVYLYDVCGDLQDLISSPIIMAEEVTNRDNECEANKIITEYDDSYCYDSYTWTFYKLGTVKGTVTLRWIGISNGCYSEEVDVIKGASKEIN